MPVSENDKKIVLSAMSDLGAKDINSAKGVDLITNKVGQKGPRYRDKQLVASILQALANERKVIRKAGEKTASYYLAPSQPAAPKPVTTYAPAPEQSQQKTDNPYL
jgi:hypothetical protein